MVAEARCTAGAKPKVLTLCAAVTTVLVGARKALADVIGDERFAFDNLETTNLNATRKSARLRETVDQLDVAERLIDEAIGTIEDARR
jgi:hypothetical protein